MSWGAGGPEDCASAPFPRLTGDSNPSLSGLPGGSGGGLLEGNIENVAGQQVVFHVN